MLLAERLEHVVAIDISGSMIDLARARRAVRRLALIRTVNLPCPPEAHLPTPWTPVKITTAGGSMAASHG
jgi:hypothetical protein